MCFVSLVFEILYTMQFSYKAKNKEGTTTEGVIEASDKFVAAKQLRTQGLVPISIIGAKRSGAIKIPFVDSLFGRVKLHEKIIFARNLSGMLSAGLSLYRALTVLEKQTKNEKFKSVLTVLIKEIDQGGTLSEGMEKFPAIFSTLFVSMIRAGEESGGLSQSLKEIGQNLEKSYELNRKIKGALMYPSIIVSAIILIGILMMVFVVPTLTKTFKELNVELPASTRLIIFISDSLSNSPILTFGLLFLCIGGLVMILRMKGMKKYFDFLVLRLPVVGKIVKEINAARTARTLSSLLSAGVDMTKALTITKEVLQNRYYKAVLDISISHVQKGIALSTIYKERTDLYPVMVGEMMEVGEETGKLATMLEDIASFYEAEVDAKTKDLSTIIEPVLMVFIGGAVGFFAVSMITPMYSLVDTL